MRRGSLEHLLRRAHQIALLPDRLVDSERKSNCLIDLKKRSGRDGLDRSVGGEPQLGFSGVADPAGADRVPAFCASVVSRGIDAHANVRMAPDWAHLTDEQLRTEQFTVLF